MTSNIRYKSRIPVKTEDSAETPMWSRSLPPEANTVPQHPPPTSSIHNYQRLESPDDELT